MMPPNHDLGNCAEGQYCHNNYCVGCQDIGEHQGVQNFCHHRLVVQNSDYCPLAWFVELCPKSCNDCTVTCTISDTNAVGESCDCSGNTCSDAEFCYDDVCNANPKGNEDCFFFFFNNNFLFVFFCFFVTIFSKSKSVKQ